MDELVLLTRPRTFSITEECTGCLYTAAREGRSCIDDRILRNGLNATWFAGYYRAEEGMVKLEVYDEASIRSRE